MNNILQPLQNCTDITDLKPALQSICARFGSVARLDILAASQAGKRQALCFLRMDSAEQEDQLVRELGVGRFGGDLVLVIDLPPRGEGNSAAMLSRASSGLREQPAAA